MDLSCCICGPSSQTKVIKVRVENGMVEGSQDNLVVPRWIPSVRMHFNFPAFLVLSDPNFP